MMEFQRFFKPPTLETARYFFHPPGSHNPHHFFPQNDSDLSCFCQKYPDNCPPAGTHDMMNCRNAPLIVSKAHFYDAEPSLLEGVQGLRPNKTEHDTFLHFEPVGYSTVLDLSLIID
jgi:hypothetical protein